MLATMGAYGGYPSLYPVLADSLAQRGSLGTQRVVGDSVDTYYSWDNAKGALAANAGRAALLSSDSDNPLASMLITFGALTVGEKVVKWYNRRLQGLEKRFPKFADFRNSHPILGNIVAWIPGAGLALSLAGTFAFGARAVTRMPMVRQVLESKTGRMVGLIAVLAVTVLTSFLGILARKGLGEVNNQGKEYRQLKQNYPELAQNLHPNQLKQLAKARRNQMYLEQRQLAEQERYRRDLDPFYGLEHTLESQPELAPAIEEAMMARPRLIPGPGSIDARRAKEEGVLPLEKPKEVSESIQIPIEFMGQNKPDVSGHSVEQNPSPFQLKPDWLAEMESVLGHPLSPKG